ncbi:unnamed protein product [Effrenium voratum]|uniref:Fe2OG dioxygenase domain-containing protein n=1 Tax=Effrenium voratum TaxID=2562239 RepID=A0AA36J0H8_9DINO|nr:unnamed protein product [Effrenium voratum]
MDDEEEVEVALDAGEIWRLRECKEDDAPSTGWRPSDPELSSNAPSEGSDLEQIPCTANGRIPIPSDFEQCPHLQSFVRCGPHHRAELEVLSQEDVGELKAIWRRYRDDLTAPRFQKKPKFSDKEFDTLYRHANKVVSAMVAEYKVPMVLDQATISNTNHIGHPPHADNVQFDSVWWQGERVPKEDEVQAAREGAYVLWRNEKTSYRSYSCSVSLCDPAGYEGGLVQFFRGFGIKEPVANYKCQEGHGIAFCGCHRNIHAVTGVTSGFRLVFLIWTRPPHVRVPENQMHTCYFRPGTGHGVWLTTADIQRHLAKRNGRGELRWAPVGEDDTCRCAKCTAERKKARWQDCGAPETRIGNATEEKAKEHCPLPPPLALCATHGRWSLGPVISKADIRTLKQIWLRHHDDLNKPAYTEKPELSQAELAKFKHVAFKVLRAMARSLNEELELDQAMVSQTSHQGDPPHADNVQFDSVWWQGRRIRERDEVRAAQHGAAVHYALGTENRNYCAMVLLSEPWDYKGGDLEFFGGWGDKDSELSIRPAAGHAWGYCGCHRGIHAVRGVRSGERLALLVWTRPQGTVVAEEQASLCYFRPSSGQSVWLTSADLEHARRCMMQNFRWDPPKIRGQAVWRRQLPFGSLEAMADGCSPPPEGLASRCGIAERLLPKSFTRSFDQHFQRLDTIIAKIHAQAPDACDSDAFPQEEPIHRALWRLSGLEAQLREKEAELDAALQQALQRPSFSPKPAPDRPAPPRYFSPPREALPHFAQEPGRRGMRSPRRERSAQVLATAAAATQTEQSLVHPEASNAAASALTGTVADAAGAAGSTAACESEVAEAEKQQQQQQQQLEQTSHMTEVPPPKRQEEQSNDGPPTETPAATQKQSMHSAASSAPPQAKSGAASGAVTGAATETANCAVEGGADVKGQTDGQIRDKVDAELQPHQARRKSQVAAAEQVDDSLTHLEQAPGEPEAGNAKAPRHGEQGGADSTFPREAEGEAPALGAQGADSSFLKGPEGPETARWPADKATETPVAVEQEQRQSLQPASGKAPQAEQVAGSGAAAKEAAAAEGDKTEEEKSDKANAEQQQRRQQASSQAPAQPKQQGEQAEDRSKQQEQVPSKPQADNAERPAPSRSAEGPAHGEHGQDSSFPKEPEGSERQQLPAENKEATETAAALEQKQGKSLQPASGKAPQAEQVAGSGAAAKEAAEAAGVKTEEERSAKANAEQQQLQQQQQASSQAPAKPHGEHGQDSSFPKVPEGPETARWPADKATETAVAVEQEQRQSLQPASGKAPQAEQVAGSGAAAKEAAAAEGDKTEEEKSDKANAEAAKAAASAAGFAGFTGARATKAARGAS